MPPRLDLVDLDQPTLEGYRRFISCWLSRDAGPTFIVDPGPVSTAPLLIERLRDLGVKELDYILLTHIHLDHGGAAAHLLEAFPSARVACHQSGRKHLKAPQRLWEGSCEVLGKVAETYGEPRPVPEESLASMDDLVMHGILAVPTPGHASHHLSFLQQDVLFLGEAAGTFLDLGEGRWYLRPATPPRFFLDTARKSLERLLALEPMPLKLAFAHHGLLEGQSLELLTAARDQLLRWVSVVRRIVDQRPDLEFDILADQLVQQIRSVDPYFDRQDELPEDIRVREQDFTRQSLLGMVGYVKNESTR